MEIFLLLLDELDDAVTVLWSLLPRLLPVIAAGTFIAAAGFAFPSFG